MTKKTIIKYVVIAIILIGALVGIKFLIDHLTKPDTPDYYGQYVGNDGYSINIDKDGLHLTLDGETETYQDYTIDGNTISYADQKVYFYENNKVLSAGIKGNELFNMSCDTPTRNSNFAGEWISYDSSFGVTLTYIFNSNGTFTRYQALVNNYEAGTYTLKDGVLILSYINAFTNANYYTEVCYIDDTHTLHTTVFVKNLSDFIPAVQTPTPDISQPSDNDTPSTDDDSPSEPTYTITYYLDGGTPAPNAQAYFTESDLPLWLTVPIKQGYSFKGWYVDADFSDNALTEIPENAPLEDYSLYAKWEPQIYYITYNVGQGTMPTEYVESFNQTNLPLSIANINPTRTGYTFDGWYSNSSFLGEPITQLTEAKSYELYAKWEPQIYYITYNVGQGTMPTEYVESFNQTNLPLSIANINPTRTGYTFDGWYSNSSFLGEPITQLTEAKSYELYAKWEPQIYYITYNVGQGTMPTEYVESFNQTNLPLSIANINPTRTGYTFDGWYSNSSFLGEPITQLTETKSYELYAKYSENISYTITYKYNDMTSTQTVRGGDIFTLITPSRQGYNFSDWYDYDNYQTVNNGIYNYNKDITLTARWEIINYNINYNLDGGSLPEDAKTSFNINSLPYSLPTPTKENCSFMGWYENSDFSGEPILTLSKDLLKNYTLYAKFTDNPAEYLNFMEVDGYQVIIGYVGKPYYITIPETHNGLPVTTINENAFYNCDSLTSVTIPDSVTSIGSSAFYNCYRLTSVTIGNSVTSIGSYAFRDCDSLTSVTIGNSVTSIGSYAFYDCDSLTSVTIGNSVTSIGSYAFYDCDGLTSVTIPNSVTSLGDYAFRDCDSLTSVTIGNSVTSIGSDAFYNCTSLTSVTIPDGLDLDYDDFNNTDISTTIKDNVRYMQFNNNPYYYAYDMVVDSATTLTIDKDCKAISIINSSITRVNISDLSSWCEISFDGYETNPLYRGADLYLNGTLVEGDIIIPSTVNIIRNYVFYNYDCITSVTIPNSVTSIGSSAFSGCDSLTSVTIGDSVTSIGSSAFSGCDSLTSVTIGDSVTSIGSYAFYDCDGLTSVTIGDSVTSIEYEAFANCDGLERVTIGDSVTSIISGAFYNCRILSVNYTSTIDQWAQIKFGNYYSNPIYYAGNLYINNELVTEANITTATSINAYAFYNCDRLTSVTIPNSVTSIGSYAFYDCYRLTSVTIGNSVTSIGSYAFYDCDSLTSVVIPDSVTSIGRSAFYDCSSLTSVYYMGNAEQWSEITIGSDNYYLASAATRYYYSETTPTDDGNYWHYVDGVVTIWE